MARVTTTFGALPVGSYFVDLEAATFTFYRKDGNGRAFCFARRTCRSMPARRHVSDYTNDRENCWSLGKNHACVLPRFRFSTGDRVISNGRSARPGLWGTVVDFSASWTPGRGYLIKFDGEEALQQLPCCLLRIPAPLEQLALAAD